MYQEAWACVSDSEKGEYYLRVRFYQGNIEIEQQIENAVTLQII